MSLRVERQGFAFCERFSPCLSTVDVAGRFGPLVEIEKILPHAGIPNVQLLIPRSRERAPKNRYSGHYGLDAFPFHTDLAHWAVPPRYVLLRCLVGREDVETRILASAHIIDRLGEPLLRKAVLRLRSHRPGASGLLRALSCLREQKLFRWDSIFLEPMNDPAERLQHLMKSPALDGITRLCLQNRGDTLLLDNWRFLHSRSAVPLGCDRQIERAYLLEVKGNDGQG